MLCQSKVAIGNRSPNDRFANLYDSKSVAADDSKWFLNRRWQSGIGALTSQLAFKSDFKSVAAADAKPKNRLVAFTLSSSHSIASLKADLKRNGRGYTILKGCIHIDQIKFGG